MFPTAKPNKLTILKQFKGLISSNDASYSLQQWPATMGARGN